MSPVVILYAKAPIPGLVKTRLAAGIGRKAAADLHARFVQVLIERLLPHFQLELHLTEPWPAWASLGVPVEIQTEGDLGNRMLHTLETALNKGIPRALILGTDAPTIPLGHVRHLLDNPEDVVLGPTEDGGYYGIAASRVHPRMFFGVEWSTPRALQQTVTACRAAGLSVAVGPDWWDVDDSIDLDRLRSESPEFRD